MSSPGEEGSQHQQTSTPQGSSFITTSVNHPRLRSTPDAESIRVFLRLYNRYNTELIARAQQHVDVESTTTEPISPLSLKFCADQDYRESSIDLGIIPGVQDYDSLTDDQLRLFLEGKCKDSPQTTTLDVLDHIMERDLSMNMHDRDPTSRMQGLFVSYTTILRRNGLSSVKKDHAKVAVYHVLEAVRPYKLRDRLETDLEFSHKCFKKDFTGFFAHAVKLSEAFKLVDNGPRKNRKPKTSRSGGGNGSGETTEKTTPHTAPTPKNGKEKCKGSKTAPDCPHEPCKKKGLKHLIKDCRSSTAEEKQKLFDELRAIKAHDGPSKSTRGQKKSPASGIPSGHIGRLSTKDDGRTVDPRKPSCDVTLSDGQAILRCIGRCDNGSDDTIISPRIAEKNALKGIGKIAAIETVTLEVALKKATDDKEGKQTFTFSRSWTSPRTILHLSSGQLALINVTFLIADGELACEDILIGLPVLEHLQVDSKTLLEASRATLDNTDCSHIGNPTSNPRGGIVSRIMLARLNRVQDDSFSAAARVLDPTRPRVNFNTARNEHDPFPDPSLLDSVDLPQHADIREAVGSMLTAASDNGLPDKNKKELKSMVADLDVFRTSFSAGPAARIALLRIDLVSTARPVKVRLRNYCQEQRAFLADFVQKLVHHGMAYSNPTSPWACAPLLVPKPGPARFRFTVDLRPVNAFTVKHQYPLPNLEHELTKLSASKYFATFDLSSGYWQLALDKEAQALHSFITPDGIFSPTRVLHGTTNATSHLQAAFAEIMSLTLREFIISWLDDLLPRGNNRPPMVQ